MTRSYPITFIENPSEIASTPFDFAIKKYLANLPFMIVLLQEREGSREYLIII